MSSNFLVFHTSGGISTRSGAFLFLIFLSTTLSSSCVNCPSLMSSGFLMIFVMGSSVTLDIHTDIQYSIKVSKGFKIYFEFLCDFCTNLYKVKGDKNIQFFCLYKLIILRKP